MKREPTSAHHHVFDTAIGPCAVAWNDRGLSAVQLPEKDRATTERRLVAKAASAGATGWEGARDVGEAMGRNPVPVVIPCQRVLAAGGKLGGFSARGGAQTKLKLLAIEGAKAAAQGDLFA